MFLPACPSGSTTKTINTTFQPNSPTGAPSHTLTTFKPGCPTAIQGVAGQTFVTRCPSGAIVHTSAGFQGACPTSAKTP